ncbi:MAG: hypothetical protein BGO39_03250 [Chloroflexi bacterium 54-19]|nr:MAG: hypothetical protein BGO39_03250 [Chloroflexi bacterium 54-19]
MNRRRFIALTGGALTAAAILAACGDNTPTSGTVATTAATNATTAASAATTAAGAATTAATTAASATTAAANVAPNGIKLVLLNQSRGQAAALEALAKTYLAQTGVEVTINTAGPTDYLQKLQASSQSGDMPDMYSALAKYNDMAPYYKAGWAMNLQPEMDKGWSKNFSSSVLKQITWKEGNPQGLQPGIYGAPWEINTYAVLGNPTIFKKAGLDLSTPPATMPEFIDQLKKINNSKSAPFLLASSNTALFIQHYVSNFLTDDEISQTFGGKLPWKSDAWRNALQLIVDLRDAGAIANNALPTGSSDNATGEKEFFNVQDLATYYDSAVSISVAKTTAPDFTTFISFPLPKAGNGKLEPRSVGGFGRGMAINPKGKHPDEALKFIKWMTDPAQEKQMFDTVPLLPANPNALDTSKLSPQVTGFSSLVDKTQVISNPLKAQVNEAMQKGIQSLVLKEKSVDQVLDDLEAAQRS